MTWILTTIGAILAGAVAKPVTVWFGQYTNSIKQDRALARLRGMYKRGQRIVGLWIDDGGGVTDHAAARPWYIVEIAKGRVVLGDRKQRPHRIWYMTGQEFERAHVILEVNG